LSDPGRGILQPRSRCTSKLNPPALEHGLNPGRIHRAGNQLLEKIMRDINGRRHHRCLLLAWHTCSLAASWYASHTKFLTRSPRKHPALWCAHAGVTVTPAIRRV